MIACIARAGAQEPRPPPRTPQWQPHFAESEPLWRHLLEKNPALAGAEEFVRGFIAEIRSTNRAGNAASPFGENFGKLLAGRSAVDCFDFALCNSKLTPAFRLAEPPGATDIVRYLFAASCFGFVEDKDYRYEALKGWKPWWRPSTGSACSRR